MEFVQQKNRSIDSSSLIFKATVLSSTLLMAGVGLGAVFLPSLKQAYPEISDVLLKSFVSLPNASQLIALLLVGLLTNYFGKKSILLFGSLLFTLSGLTPMITTDFTMMLISRLALGFSMGLIQPIGTSLLADYYTEQERHSLMGIQSSIAGLSNIIMAFIAGLFIATSWKFGFSVYIIGLVVFLLTLFYLPNGKGELADNYVKKSSSTKALTKEVLGWIVAMFLFNLAFSAGILEFGLSLVETGVGTPADAAKIVAYIGIISLFSGVVFGKYMRITKGYAGIIAIILMGLGNGIAAISHSLLLFVIGMILINLGFGLFMPYIMSSINRNSTKETSASITGLVLSAGSIANFLSTYIYAGFGSLFNNHSSQFGFWLGVISCVLLIGVLCGKVNDKRKVGGI